MTSPANLAPGIYTITSFAGNGGFVSRSDREDFSLNPKAVVANPKGVRPYRVYWEIRPGPNGSNILTNDRGRTFVRDNTLYAALLDEPPSEQWIIQSVGGQGKDLYTISTRDRFKGWVVPENEGSSPIAIRPLIVGPSEPPFFPPFEVFKIERLVDE